MKLDGQDIGLDGGTLELETRDMAVAQRVRTAIEKGQPVMLDATEYYPVSVDVRSHVRHPMYPVATIKLRA